jgi:ribonuclease HI
MATAKKKWYVVWTGQQAGIYDSWEACKAQVHGVAGARYRSFESRAEAEHAYASGAPAVVRSANAAKKTRPRIGGPHLPSVCVDAACDMTTGVMEYRGVDTETQTELFRMGPYQDSTNNIGEFLAVVHALAMLKRQGNPLPIYSDSRTALSWVKKKHAKTTVDRTPNNADVFDLLERAEQWLQNNTFANPVIKWETKLWGENPADFGRK